MDKEIEIKEEDPLTNDIASQNQKEFFHVSMKTSNDTMLADTDCDMTVKTEVKSEAHVIKHPVNQIKTESATCSNNWEMLREPEIEHQTLLSDFGSQNEGQFLLEDPLIVDKKLETSNDTMLVDTDFDMMVKTEVKSETHFIKHPVNQIKTESATCSNNWEMLREAEIEHQTLLSDFGSQNEGEFLLEDPLIVDKKYNRDHEMYNKIEIKEESWSLETETSSVRDNIKDADRFPVKSSRLFQETVAGPIKGISPLHLAEVTSRETNFCNEMDHPEYEDKNCDVTCDVLTAKEYSHTNQYSKCSDEADRCISNLCLKPRSFSHMSGTPQLYSISEGFSNMSPLKTHILIPDSKKPYQCIACSKSFARPSHLDIHYLVHEGKRPHQCKVCNKRFTRLSTLKIHNSVHEGKRPHKCKVCDRSFSQLSTLRTHSFVHESKKPHQCKVCNKSFTQLGSLKTHNLVHEGKKPHQCNVCNKSFTRLTNMKAHYLVRHEGKKIHQCKVCDKSFPRLSDLKRHNLTHEGKRQHKCKLCDRSYFELSGLKVHYLVHEGKKPHQCKVCNRSFNQLSTLKTHILVHGGKKPHECKVCNKSFIRLSRLKKHSLIHEGNAK